MTHLSDLSYLQRTVNMVWICIWVIIYVYRYDRFSALQFRKLIRFELRSVVTLAMLLNFPLLLSYEISSVRLKYIEGYWLNPVTNNIEIKPAFLWSKDNIKHIEPLYYTLACCLALENCCFILLQSFWSYISKTVAKTSFMSSFEFKVNAVASIFVTIMFPTVQYIVRNNFVYREAIPQLLFSVILAITCLLGIRTHFRLAALIAKASEIQNDSTASVVQKLEYFKDMNLILTVSFFGCGVPLGIASVDGLLPNPIIARNKFVSDLLISQLNFFQIIVWVTLTLIFYPRKTGTGSPFAHSSTSGTGANRSAHRPKFSEIKPQEERVNKLNELDYPSQSFEMSKRARHERTFSHGSNSVAIAMDTPASPTSPTSPTEKFHPLTPPPRIGSANKSQLVSNTIYYHDGLAKVQQNNDQDNEYRMGLENGTINNNLNAYPQRSLSQSSQYDHQEPKRTLSNGSQTFLIPKPNKNPSRNQPIPLDPRTTDISPLSSQSTIYTDGIPENLYRSVSPSGYRMQSQTFPDLPDPRFVDSNRVGSSMGRRFSEEDEEDAEAIRIAYIHDLSRDTSSAAVTNSFYDNVPVSSSINPATGPSSQRPYSPRQF